MSTAADTNLRERCVAILHTELNKFDFVPYANCMIAYDTMFLHAKSAMTERENKLQARIDELEAAASRVVDNSYSVSPVHTLDLMRRACTPTCTACGLAELLKLVGGYSWQRIQSDEFGATQSAFGI